MNTLKIVPVHHKTLIRLFELKGFAVKRQKGDHIIMTKPGINRPLVIKTSPRKVPTTYKGTPVKNQTTKGAANKGLRSQLMGQLSHELYYKTSGDCPSVYITIRP